MAVKQQYTVTKADFEAALATHRLSVSEVSRETGIPRHICSHFRNYGDGMKPEQLAKLRDYLEGLGVEFTDEEQPEAAAPLAAPQSLRLPAILSDDGLTQRTALVCRHLFVDERITDEQVAEAGESILDSFEQAKALLDVKLETNFLLGGYTEETDARMRELWGHLARIGLLCLHLQGRVLIDQSRFANPLRDDKPDTLGDLLFATYREALAGLHQVEPGDTAEEPEEAAA